MRDRAARLLGALCRRFGDSFYNVQPRVSRTLLRALLDASMPLTTHYGPLPFLRSHVCDLRARLLLHLTSRMTEPALLHHTPYGHACT